MAASPQSREDAGRGARSAAPLVALRDVDFAYDDRPVLRRIGFELRRGDFVGIVGPNGSGKSTLVDLIDGLHQPRAGEVLVNGRQTRAYRRKDMAREVALVPQHFDLDFDLAVREVVEMGAYSLDKEAAAVGDPELTLARLGVADLAGRRFSELSGGEKQLVVLAQALMQQAPLLLLDEPASALDPISTAKIEETLLQLKESYTIVIVTHNLQQAARIADVTAFFMLGEVVEVNDTTTMFTNPREKVTEEYVTGRFG